MEIQKTTIKIISRSGREKYATIPTNDLINQIKENHDQGAIKNISTRTRGERHLNGPFEETRTKIEYKKGIVDQTIIFTTNNKEQNYLNGINILKEIENEHFEKKLYQKEVGTVIKRFALGVVAAGIIIGGLNLMKTDNSKDHGYQDPIASSTNSLTMKEYEALINNNEDPTEYLNNRKEASQTANQYQNELEGIYMENFINDNANNSENTSGFGK